MTTTRWFSSSPSDSTSRWTPCPPKLPLRPVRHYPHVRISTRGLGPSGTSTHLRRVLPGTHYGPLRLPAAAAFQVMDSPRALSSTRMPRRASQVPRLILRHPPPSITPGGPAGASARFFPPGCRLHPIRKVGHRHLSATRPNQVHLRWGSCLHRQGRITPPRLLAYCRGNRPTPRAWLPSAGGRNYMVNEQLPWLTRFSQQDQPGLAWRIRIYTDLSLSSV